MERIQSFCVDHTLLRRGIYLSRQDGDVDTFDIRMREPNAPPFLENAAMHTIEHLFATFARNSEYAEKVIYFGPMGCRTGFYFLTRDLAKQEAIALIQGGMEQIAGYEGEIPGASEPECGNWREHDLAGARREAADFLPVIENWREKDLEYPTGNRSKITSSQRSGEKSF